jgi:hypothetical protein
MCKVRLLHKDLQLQNSHRQRKGVSVQSSYGDDFSVLFLLLEILSIQM